jgi:hypothetical protein
LVINCQKLSKCWLKVRKKSKTVEKLVEKLTKSCQKAVIKLTKVVKKLLKSCYKVVKKLAKQLYFFSQKVLIFFQWLKILKQSEEEEDREGDL